LIEIQTWLIYVFIVLTLIFTKTLNWFQIVSVSLVSDNIDCFMNSDFWVKLAVFFLVTSQNSIVWNFMKFNFKLILSLLVLFFRTRWILILRFISKWNWMIQNILHTASQPHSLSAFLLGSTTYFSKLSISLIFLAFIFLLSSFTMPFFPSLPVPSLT
jgi:hypothetical protein